MVALKLQGGGENHDPQLRKQERRGGIETVLKTALQDEKREKEAGTPWWH